MSLVFDDKENKLSFGEEAEGIFVNDLKVSSFTTCLRKTFSVLSVPFPEDNFNHLFSKDIDSIPISYGTV